MPDGKNLTEGTLPLEAISGTAARAKAAVVKGYPA